MMGVRALCLIAARVKLWLHGSSFLGLPHRILNRNHKKELLWSLCLLHQGYCRNLIKKPWPYGPKYIRAHIKNPNNQVPILGLHDVAGFVSMAQRCRARDEGSLGFRVWGFGFSLVLQCPTFNLLGIL